MIDYQEVKSLIESGCTYAVVGHHFGVSRQRIHSIYQRINRDPTATAGRSILVIDCNRANLLLSKGYSIAQVAVALGCSISTLWLRGVRSGRSFGRDWSPVLSRARGMLKKGMALKNVAADVGCCAQDLNRYGIFKRDF